jgi:hypothetical protein
MIPAGWRDRPMPTLHELTLFLGGSGDSFTGDLLRLMCKGDPGNRARLARAFPLEDQALRAWMATEPAPTFGQLEEQLAGG